MADGSVGVTVVVLDQAVEEVVAALELVAAAAVSNGAEEELVLEHAAVVVAEGGVVVAEVAGEVDARVAALGEDGVHAAVHRADDALAVSADKLLDLGDVQSLVVGAQHGVGKLDVQRVFEVREIGLDGGDGGAGILVQRNADLGGALGGGHGSRQSEDDSEGQNKRENFLCVFHSYLHFVCYCYLGRTPCGFRQVKRTMTRKISALTKLTQLSSTPIVVSTFPSSV